MSKAEERLIELGWEKDETPLSISFDKAYKLPGSDHWHCIDVLFFLDTKRMYVGRCDDLDDECILILNKDDIDALLMYCEELGWMDSSTRLLERFGWEKHPIYPEKAFINCGDDIVTRVDFEKDQTTGMPCIKIDSHDDTCFYCGTSFSIAEVLDIREKMEEK